MRYYELASRVKHLAKPDGYWYQAFAYPSDTRNEFGERAVVYTPTKYDEEDNTFGMKKFETFIRPFVDKTCTEGEDGNRYFCEMGCNAGAYLVAASSYSYYNRLFGVEASDIAFKQLELTQKVYRDFDIRIYHERLGAIHKDNFKSTAKKFSLSKFPIVDFTLLAHFTYYIDEKVLRDYFRELAFKSRYMLIINDPNASSKTLKSNSGLMFIYIRDNDWELISEIHQCKKEHQRACYAYFLKSRHLKLLDVEDLYSKQLMNRPDNIMFYSKIWPDFVRDVLNNENGKSDSTEVYKWLIEGRYGSAKFKHMAAKRRVIRWRRMIRDMKERGQYRPVKILGKWSSDIIDGCHRLGIAHLLRIKYLYAVNEKEKL